MTPRDDDSQSKRPANASDASGAGDDLRPASRDEVRAANALDERAGRTHGAYARGATTRIRPATQLRVRPLYHDGLSGSC